MLWIIVELAVNVKLEHRNIISRKELWRVYELKFGEKLVSGWVQAVLRLFHVTVLMRSIPWCDCKS